LERPKERDIQLLIYIFSGIGLAAVFTIASFLDPLVRYSDLKIPVWEDSFMHKFSLIPFTLHNINYDYIIAWNLEVESASCIIQNDLRAKYIGTWIIKYIDCLNHLIRFDERMRRPQVQEKSMFEPLNKTLRMICTEKILLLAPLTMWTGFVHGYFVADFDAVRFH